MKTGDSVDNLTAIVWCDHLAVVPQPMILTNVRHAWLKKPCYLVVEDGKIKLLCSSCWCKAVQTHLF